MPARGNAKTIRFRMLDPLTVLPAHASLLTTTMKSAVPTHTSRFERRWLTTMHPLRVSSAVEFLERIDRERRHRSTAVELAGLGRVHPHELAVLHLHADDAHAAELAADVRLGRHAAGVEVVRVADRL